MTITKQRVTCGDCGKVSDVDLVTNAPISVAVASMEAAQCQHCHGSSLGLGGAYDDAPPLSTSVEVRAGWWINRGEVGISSGTIYNAFTGTRRPHTDVPHDPADYRRCRLLLDLIPEWRANIGKVAEIYPWFKPFSDAWDELDALWAEESPKKNCPKMYKFMQTLEAAANKIRYARRK